MKKCRLCRYCRCTDESDVSGLDCEKNKVLRITNTEETHELCPGYKFSLLKLLFGI
jgi:hypothetical protein